MKPCGHPDDAKVPRRWRPGQCRFCFLYATRKDYRDLYDSQKGTPHPPDPPACAHLGPAVRVAGSSRTWHECGAGYGKVCRCGSYKGKVNGCRGCPGYEPGEGD